MEVRIPGGPIAGYASIVIADAGGVRQYVAYTGGGLFGVEAKTGKFLWRYDKTTGPVGMSVLTPVVRDGIVYSGTDNLGGAAVRLSVQGDAAKADEVYRGPKLPKTIGGAVLVGGYLYGSSGGTVVCTSSKPVSSSGPSGAWPPRRCATPMADYIYTVKAAKWPWSRLRPKPIGSSVASRRRIRLHSGPTAGKKPGPTR